MSARDTGLGRTRGVVLLGVDGHVVGVEAHVSYGTVQFTVVGLPDKGVAEARDRARSAILNAGLEWPSHRITVSLRPAELPKRGAALDVAIAVALLAAAGQVPGEAAEHAVCVGELGLDGRLRPVRGVLVAALAARDVGAGRLYVPAAAAPEASLVPGVDVVGVHTLAGLVALLRDDPPPEVELAAADSVEPDGVEARAGSAHRPDAVPGADLADVRGQAAGRLALELAAAGGHHLAMTGPPGVGKTLLAERLPGILPPLRDDAALEVTAVHSVAGRLGPGGARVRVPPFVAPHHTATRAALVGGGSGSPRVGLVSLAHRGVLFLDEAPEFSSSVLEVLRQPLESGQVPLSRAGFHILLPARFQLVLAMNPCPCGRAETGALAGGRTCRCAPAVRRGYGSRLSGPLLDRVDLRVVVTRPSLAELAAGDAEPSSAVAARVAQARDRAAARLVSTPYLTNADVPGPALRHLLPVPAEPAALVGAAVARGALSPRGADRVVRVAWTVADLAGRACPSTSDVGTALAFRDVDLLGAA